MKSWKTSLFGILAVACAGAQTTPGLPPWAAHLLAVAATAATGLGLLFARDYDKSSEDHDLPPPPPTGAA